MRNELSHTIEDYLKVIYELTRRTGRAGTNEIAERMGVTPASVTSMIKKLAATQPPLLEYRKHHGVVLTADGERVALEILRFHRLLEVFLHQILGYEWDEVHAEADRLEHVISDQFAERIATALGDPRHDPHGDPIPSRDLQMPRSAAQPLYELRAGQQARVERVSDRDPELLRYLAGLGILPNTHLRVLEYSPFDENLRLQVDGQPDDVVLGPAVSREIYVQTETE